MIQYFFWQLILRNLLYHAIDYMIFQINKLINYFLLQSLTIWKDISHQLIISYRAQLIHNGGVNLDWLKFSRDLHAILEVNCTELLIELANLLIN